VVAGCKNPETLEECNSTNDPSAAFSSHVNLLNCTAAK
jgi:hypothetical protein